MTAAQTVALRLELGRSMRDSTDVGDWFALRLLDRICHAAPDESSPLEEECACGHPLLAGDLAQCEACRRRRRRAG